MHNTNHKEKHRNLIRTHCARLELHLAPALIKAAGNY